MLKDVVRAEWVGAYRLRVTFEDGIEGVIDVATLVPFVGVFGPLRDEAVFRQVYVEPDLGTVCWPTGADLDPDVLYAQISGQPLCMRKAVTAPLSPATRSTP